MSIPLQTKLEFLDDVVILSFGDPPGTRNEWIRAEIDNLFPTLSEAVVDELMLLSNTIHTLGEARERLREALEERDKERHLLQQAQLQQAADQPPPLQDDQLVAKLSNLELGLHQIINQLPASVVHIKLTPSLDTVVKDVGFRKLMDALDLDFPTMIEEGILEEGNFSNFEFDWVWGQKNENESYEPFQKAYAEHSLPGVVVCVSDGERLMDKLLFTTPLWSLRKFDEKQRKFGKVLYRGEISGRTDLVLMDYDPGADILRHNVKVAIEVKRNCDINAPAKLKSALREATTQLLGLCGDNSNNTPPVILTDFTSLFIVLQLHVKSNYPLKFEILAWNCSNIKSTLHKASMVSMLPCVSADFGRPDTPNGSDGDS